MFKWYRGLKAFLKEDAERIFAMNRSDPIKFKIFNVAKRGELASLIRAQTVLLQAGENKRILVLIHGMSVKCVAGDLKRYPRELTSDDLHTFRATNHRTGGMLVVHIEKSHHPLNKSL